MIQNYQRFGAAFYDRDKPWAEISEVDYFADWISKSPAPALEAMCGSGRLLIPLLKRGLQVEGVDYSPSMLANLETRCRLARVIPPRTYLQSITQLKIPKRYGLIFIALGSLQLISETELEVALQKMRSHLGAQGKLVIDTFIPWEWIEPTYIPKIQRRKMALQKNLVELTTEVEIDRNAQYYRLHNYYELKSGSDVLQTEREFLTVRWYYPEQFTALLNKYSFDVQVRPVPLTSKVPRRFIFEASLTSRVPL